MPQQLIYTSAPRGIVSGRSGYCTVARSASMREAVMLQLEKLSYYQHLSLVGGKEHPISACRIIDIRGARFHVLSRIQDAGLDFTGRTNFIAHHLVFTPEEVRQSPIPPVALREWRGWVTAWADAPQLFEKEDWSSLGALANNANVPARTWQQVTGEATNGYGLLEARNGSSFRVDDLTNDAVLQLLAESLELLELRDTRRDFRATAWQYTFTTAMQEQDNPADFRWRCIHSDNPAANRFATPDCRPLSAVRTTRCSQEETVFARSGRQPPRFVIEPQDLRIIEGETARFVAKAEGIPAPSYQWFSVDRSNNGQVLEGQTNPELLLSNPALGISRYVVRAGNSLGEATTGVATLSVDQKMRLAQSSALRSPTPTHKKSEADIEKQRNRLQAQEAEKLYFQKKLLRSVLAIFSGGILLAAACILFPHLLKGRRSSSGEMPDQPSISSQAKFNSNRDAEAPLSSTNTITSSAVSDKPMFEQQDHVAAGLPAGWTVASIGSQEISSNKATVSDNLPPIRFSLSAIGEGFQPLHDSVFFVYRTNVQNEFAVILQEVKPSNATNYDCGVMIRGSENVDAPFLFVGKSITQIRLYLRHQPSQTNGTFYTHSIDIPKERSKEAICFKLILTNGTALAAYRYANETDQPWLPFDEYRLQLNESRLVGFAACSGNLSSSIIAVYSDISTNIQSR